MPPSPPAAAPARGLTAAWLRWWALGAGLWLALVDRLEPSELLAGAFVAALAATAAVIVRRERIVLVRPGTAALRPVLPALGRTVSELPLLAAVLWRRGVLRRPEHGTLTERAWTATDVEDPTQAGARVAALVVGSLAPARVAIDVMVDRGVLVEHHLEAER